LLEDAGAGVGREEIPPQGGLPGGALADDQNLDVLLADAWRDLRKVV